MSPSPTTASPAVEPALFHLGYSASRDAAHIRETFRDVKFVLLGGTFSRARRFAEAYLALARDAADGGPAAGRRAPPAPPNLCTTGRYFVALADARVLVAAHGMGRGSADTLLHELASLLRLAGAAGFAFVRAGSCGGVGVAPGALAVSARVVDGRARPALHTTVLGRAVARPAAVCPALAAALAARARDMFGADAVRVGTTMCCDAFYEEQARLDGALCDITRDEQRAFLERCRDRHGVINFEMESMALAAFCTRAAIPCAVVCAALVDRLDPDGVDSPTAPEEKLRQWEDRPVQLVAKHAFEELRAADV